ncbi:MAG: hypothetical protein HZB26_04340 [Candidatus Hydrogenedentes bacterium]|nr:hypothetical protein [Candidatus Hydrogenedentota bacterium]
MAGKPDVLEKCVRFVCGSLVCGVLAVSAALQIVEPRPSSYWVAGGLAIVLIVSMGLMAMKLGDRFWQSTLPRLLWWW